MDKELYTTFTMDKELYTTFTYAYKLMDDPSTPSLDQHLSVHCTTDHTSLDSD